MSYTARALSHAPSAKRLATFLNIDMETAKKARAYMNGQRDPALYSPAYQAWERQCLNKPDWLEGAQCALNALLGTHGVEAIRGEEWSAYHGDVQAVYLNTGDSYAATLVYCYRTDRWLLTDWATYVEKNTTRYGIV